MKKLMIAAAIVCAAAFAEAATATWSVSALYVPTKTNLTPGSGTAGSQKFAANTTPAGLAIEFFYLTQGDDPEWVSLGSNNKIGSTAGATTKVDFWTESSTAYTSLVNNKSVDFKVEITYTTSEGVFATSGTVNKSLENLPNSAVGITVPMNNKAWTFTAVPEPTSGLLLLLGVAGLALRRRRA